MSNLRINKSLTMRYYIFILFIMLFSLTISAQTKQELIDKVCKDLLVAETGNPDINCIYDEETRMPLSCFDINSKPEWVSDFNGDGEDDILVYKLDEGLGGGGNAFGYEYIVAIMKNREIDMVFSIFGGGKFSYALLQVNKVENNKIYATYDENPMVEFKNEEDLRSIPLVLYYKDSTIIEESYLRCAVAEMDKRIFKSNIPYTVNRKPVLNDLLELGQNEYLIIDEAKDDKIFASFDGCSNINLYFSYDIPFNNNLINDNGLQKETFLSFISLLEENTRYTSTFKLLKDQIQSSSPLDNDKDHLIRQTIPLKNNWSAYILMNNIVYDKGRRINMVIRLDKKDGNSSNDFWENIKR